MCRFKTTGSTRLGGVTFFLEDLYLEDRWSRTRLLVGEEACYRLAQARIMVVGLGGVGSFVAEGLARSGIGSLTLVDFDQVAISNINRQLVALTSTLDKPKAEVMAERIKDINPDCSVEACVTRCEKDTIDELLSNRPDYVVDAIDSVMDKVCLIKECLTRFIPIISAMGAGNRLDPTRFEVADISQTHTCPLARKLRHELRKINIEQGLKVVFSREKPIPTKTGHPVGSISFVPSVAGLIIAGAVVQDLLHDNDLHAV
jgi:tRNA A37 threonylcarbamoyladenosine dehydratase